MIEQPAPNIVVDFDLSESGLSSEDQSYVKDVLARVLAHELGKVISPESESVTEVFCNGTFVNKGDPLE